MTPPDDAADDDLAEVDADLGAVDRDTDADLDDGERDDEPTDDELAEIFDVDPVINPSSTVGKFRRTGAGMVLNGVALGLAEVFEGSKHEDPPIVQEAPGEPDTPRRVDAHLDPDDPAASSVTVRSWRIAETDAAEAAVAAPAAESADDEVER